MWSVSAEMRSWRIRGVVVDSLSVPELHKVSLIVMLPPRAVRRMNTKTISHHMHWTPVLLEI